MMPGPRFPPPPYPRRPVPVSLTVPVPTPWPIVACASTLELLRHGRPVAFALGFLIALLIHGSVLGGLVGTPQDRGTTGPVVVSLPASPARAALMVEARSADAGMAEQRVRAGSTSPSSTGSARAITVPRSYPRADVAAIIRGAFAARGLDADRAVAVATCESHLDPAAIGDHGEAVGLWQWHLAPWQQHAREVLGRSDDLRADPVLSSVVTAATVARQGWGIWTCGR